MPYFDLDDADRFFGRERLTADLVSYLSDHPFLAVIGASGSGKSSVVRAGMLPALAQGEIVWGSDYWYLLKPFSPTANPIKALATALTQDEPDSVTLAFMDDLRADQRTLDIRAAKFLDKHPTCDHLLLVVDQFEELFTLCRDQTERKAFVDNLLAAVGDEGLTTIVITLRADFYHHCAEFDNLRLAVQDHQIYIGSMSEEELRSAIEEPARLGGWDLEPGLVDLMLQDVAQEPGALPLLSQALSETWERRSGRMLTLAGYTAAGRVQGAIARTADTVLTRDLQSPEQRLIARNIFVRLTRFGEGEQDTRRRVALDELLFQGEQRAEVSAVLKTLADRRLITTDQDQVEVAHEALIREWPTLRRWLEADREALLTHRRLTEEAEEWAELDRDAGALYRGLRLGQAEEWAADHAAEMNDLEREFLEASRQQVERRAAQSTL